ncbi:Uncharacterized protein BN1183_CQ_00450 [Pantoea ananatis]|nr:Uncharacterized protein BN1183_CQ_00450 [Pantoea ananatis]
MNFRVLPVTMCPNETSATQYWNPMVPELAVTDFAASWAFYVEAIGFKVRIRRENPDLAYLCYGQVQLMIEQVHDGGWLTAEMAYPLGRGINLQIDVPDIETLYSRLLRLSTPLFRPLRENCYDTGERVECQKEFLVQDPDGYLLRFCQPVG